MNSTATTICVISNIPIGKMNRSDLDNGCPFKHLAMQDPVKKDVS